MIKLLKELQIDFTTSAEREIAKDIKEKLGYVALDYEAEKKAYNESNQKHKSYTLPDGKSVTLADQRFRVGEILFKPDHIGKEMVGVH